MLRPVPAHTHSPGPGARALYLGTRDRKHVSCTAEALVVRNDKSQTMRYPIERIARVVSSVQTDWSGDALALCLRSGIGITWMDAQGNALGSCYPFQRVQPSLPAALELWLEDPYGVENYQNWLRTRRMAVQVHWGLSQATAIDPTQWETTKRMWVYGQRVEVHLPTALYGHCLAYTSAQLAAHGLTPLFWDANAQPVKLDEDLCQLLWAEMNLCTGALADTAHGEANLVTLFERWSARNAAALSLHLSSLYRTAMKTTSP